MNKPNILSIARQQLSDAISNFQTPPCSPLKVSPWIAMSLLQKAIRRGKERLALRAAATLLRDAPDRLWRRVRLRRFSVSCATSESTTKAPAIKPGLVH